MISTLSWSAELSGPGFASLNGVPFLALRLSGRTYTDSLAAVATLNSLGGAAGIDLGLSLYAVPRSLD